MKVLAREISNTVYFFYVRIAISDHSNKIYTLPKEMSLSMWTRDMAEDENADNNEDNDGIAASIDYENILYACGGGTRLVNG
uniref:AlNc14C259G9776 protein n=1 Tax=Albugo laibachii Nc14 TaxID=890382 RepID=F0WTV1_9STRA|nr:AlNc14C259G9776 [Albugo laibachii Nc14]|eukprot:CCA24795.1 AlNc14C259G9776 [Albugo laibachii Nc14]